MTGRDLGGPAPDHVPDERDHDGPKRARQPHDSCTSEDDECDCSQCQEAAWDRQQERMRDYTPPAPFTVWHKDHPEDCRG